MARVINENPLRGMNIYTDKKHRTIYYNPLTKEAMQVPPTDFKRFRMFQARFISILAVFLLVMLIFSDWLHMSIWIPIVIALIACGLFEYFWYRFQKSLPPYKNFDKAKLTSSYDVTITQSDKKKAWLRIFLLILLGVLLIVNAYQLHYDTGMMIACYAAMIFLFAYAGFSVWQLSKARVKS